MNNFFNLKGGKKQAEELIIANKELLFQNSEKEKRAAELIIANKELAFQNDEKEKRAAELILINTKLSMVLQEVKETINILVTSSIEIQAATTNSVLRITETTNAINIASNKMDGILESAKQSTERAKNVADNAQRSVQVSHNGQKSVDETIKGMNHIHEQMTSISRTVAHLSEQTHSIVTIIASVTDIADQSNLLAVNAAIEAAKASEQGKGFAVVAQEIKNLASQSKQSISQVRKILNDVQEATSEVVHATEQGKRAVEAGVKQSTLSGEAIQTLAESINESFQAAKQIVASNQQQVIGLDQIGLSMQNINLIGKGIVVRMLKSEKSAEELNGIGQKLKEVVERFSI